MRFTALAATSRRGSRLSAAALLAATALSLTACHGHTGKPVGAAPAAPSTPEAGTGRSEPATSRPDTSDGGPTPSGSRPGDRPACTPDMLGFHAGGVHRPAGHMVLAVTNLSDRTCTFAAQPYPLLRFHDEQRTATPVIEASKPQAVVALAPDRTAYAGITTAAADGSGGEGKKISQFGVALAARTDPAQVGLDSGPPVHVNHNTARVTYWQSSRADALKW
ncbi:DUF4232 domain-containing protein [Streptomyces sp. NPDC017993]|uniref:DUF4232 domain-containing protein n=1 Tax=Streptomyces sp. NPDC017993 TaxID=3365027 RepID=UPI0037A9B8A7